MPKTISILFASLVALSACGSTDLERSGTGAAVGAVAALATSNNMVTGAFVGGIAGALCDDLVPDLCY